MRHGKEGGPSSTRRGRRTLFGRFSPRHDLTLAEMETPAIEAVVEAWCAQTEELGRRYPWIQVFENKGELMGCSNPHPHGQIWAGSELPDLACREDEHQRAYRRSHQEPLLLEHAALESAGRKRLTCSASFSITSRNGIPCPLRESRNG